MAIALIHPRFSGRTSLGFILTSEGLSGRSISFLSAERLLSDDGKSGHNEGKATGLMTQARLINNPGEGRLISAAWQSLPVNRL
jgi:hypothetical protein